tara:strand:+ start:156 stop:671 length:516 start_codon:yes stop_codon:yes gene_type:complete
MKKKIILLLILIFIPSYLFAEATYTIDVSRVLNNSLAGKEAQKILTNKLKNATKSFEATEKKLLDDEKVIVGKKKILNKDEYEKEVKKLRDRVAKHRQNKQKTLTDIDKLRFDSRKKLLGILKPLLQEYMKSNNIKMVVDRKTVVLVENNLDISQKAIELLNNKVKTLNIK